MIKRRRLSRLTLLVTALFFGFSFNAFAADPNVKEDTNPLSPEGALTADQIPPITQIGKPMPTMQPPNIITQPSSPPPTGAGAAPSNANAPSMGTPAQLTPIR